MAPFWSLHTHTRYSAKDALSDVKALVARSAQLGYPALGVADHGTVAALTQLYLECRKKDILPVPACEMYLTPDATLHEQRSWHLTVAATTETGYRNLVGLNTLAHESFYYRPRVDLADLAAAAADGRTDGLIAATGCRSGLLVRTLVERGEPSAVRVAGNLARWFPRVYVELMNHGITADGWSDDQLVAALVRIADTVGLPVIITSDSHYVDADDARLHDILKTLVTFAKNPEDGQFSGTGYHLVDRDWLRSYFEPAVLRAGIDSLTELAESLQVRIPELDTFTLKVPDVTHGGDPDDILGARALDTLATRFPGDETRAQRLLDELQVIADTDFAGYLLFVASITDHMSSEGIWFHARGSVGGSFTTYLLGISQDDPVTEGVAMNRFLSGDRATPPDIDLDIDSAYRAYMVDWISARYAVRPVATYVQYRLDSDKGEEAEQTGSLKVEYFATKRKQAFANREPYDAKNDRIPAEDWRALVELSDRAPIKHIGTNAAGFLVASTDAELSRIPLVRIKEGRTLVTAYDKDDVEHHGFPKIDLLGATMVQAMRIACTLIRPDDARSWFFDGIPHDDPRTMARIAAGELTGTFQLEGYAQRRGIIELEPTRTVDVIAAQALFRPGVSPEFLGTYMRRRRGQETVPDVHPDIAVRLADTYGVAIYQEQVVDVLRAIGMAPAELTRMLKAVKASGKSGLVKAREAVDEALPAIIALAQGRGWSNDDLEWLSDALTDYGAGYSFGKAHSVRYGKFAYRTAYLAEHHPVQFWCGVLTAYTKHKNAKKINVELLYLQGARRNGITVHHPHINHSGVDYTITDNGAELRQGLRSVEGVGRTAAHEIASKAPFTSIRDFGQRCNPTKVSGAKNLALGKPIESCGENTVAGVLYRQRAMAKLPSGLDVQTVLAFT